MGCNFCEPRFGEQLPTRWRTAKREFKRVPKLRLENWA